jgi:tetratricopeptide (TPR) repeat protein
MRILFYITLFSFLFACKSKSSPEQQAVDTALESYRKTPSDSSAQAVFSAINKFVDVKGYADSTSAKLLIEAARIASAQNQTRQAVDYFKTYIVEYPDRSDVANKLSEVISQIEKLNKPELNQILYKSFSSRFPQDERTAAFQGKIENKDIMADSIVRFIGMNMFNDSTFRLNEERSLLYIDACEMAVMADPTVRDAPEHLHRAAETARTLRDIPKAIELYDWIIEKYPTHNRAATSLFLKAFTYDNDLKDFQKAGTYYNEFLAKYPQNEFAESAKFLLDNLGKSEEELKKMLEEKSKENVQ